MKIDFIREIYTWQQRGFFKRVILLYFHFKDKLVLANQMRSYFVETINTIHTKLDVMAAGLPDACCDSDKLPETKLESFTLLNTKEVRKFIEGSTKKTCTLDPVPTSIMTSCIDVLLPVTTKIVNLSLESGIFAGDCK